MSDLRNLLEGRKKVGLESGEWFNTIAPNIGVSLLGKITRIFEYEVQKQKKKAISLKLLEDVKFTGVKGEANYDIELEAGDVVNISLSGLLAYVMVTEGVKIGTIALLEYLGKDESTTIQGNHPHSWAYSFVEEEEVAL